jgi:hypothetical protein
MMEPRFTNNDSFGIGVKTPYIAIQLTGEQAIQVKNRRVELYSVGDRYFFPVKDAEGKLTGDYIIFVVFE